MKKVKLSLLSMIALLLVNNSIAGEAVGYYSSGSLKDGLSYEREAPFIHKLFKARNRLYSTDDFFEVVKLIDQVVQGLDTVGEKIQIGDLSNLKGGKATGHASHQNGIEADFVYLTVNRRLQSPSATYWEEEFVNGNKLSPNFDLPRNVQLFEFLANDIPTSRIFVDAVVKREVCHYVESKGIKGQARIQNMLRRLRIEDLHKTHYHLRLFCPASDTSCKPQSEPPMGDGCDAFSQLVIEKSERVPSC